MTSLPMYKLRSGVLCDHRTKWVKSVQTVVVYGDVVSVWIFCLFASQCPIFKELLGCLVLVVFIRFLLITPRMALFLFAFSTITPFKVTCSALAITIAHVLKCHHIGGLNSDNDSDNSNMRLGALYM